MKRSPTLISSSFGVVGYSNDRHPHSDACSIRLCAPGLRWQAKGPDHCRCAEDTLWNTQCETHFHLDFRSQFGSYCRLKRRIHFFINKNTITDILRTKETVIKLAGGRMCAGQRHERHHPAIVQLRSRKRVRSSPRSEQIINFWIIFLQRISQENKMLKRDSMIRYGIKRCLPSSPPLHSIPLFYPRITPPTFRMW